MSYHFIWVIIAIIKNSTNNKCWRGCGEKGTLLHCWREWKLVQLRYRTVWKFLKKLEKELPYDLAFHTPEHIPWDNQNSKRHMHPSTHCSTNYNSQSMEATHFLFFGHSTASSEAYCLSEVFSSLGFLEPCASDFLLPLWWPLLILLFWLRF